MDNTNNNNPNIFDHNHPEKWYLLIEFLQGNKPVVRAAGSLEHCCKFDANHEKCGIVNYVDREFWLK